MFKFYNIQSDITRGFKDFIEKSIPNIRKTQLNFLPSLMFGMISSESCASSDIAKSLNDELKWAQYDSIVKRINRFFNNEHFDGEVFFNNVIISILKNYKNKHPINRVHITFDHMFSHDNYSVFMLSLKIGKQGFPIYFECFKGSDNTDAFKIDTLKQGYKC